MSAYARFRRSSNQVAFARAFVRDTLVRWNETGALDDVLLVTSELFTNAVQHGSGWVDVHITRSPQALRIAVVDDGQGTPDMRPDPVPTSMGTGRGLRIVDALASDWGDGRDPSGRTRVWADVARR